jgi:hypothetical protein
MMRIGYDFQALNRKRSFFVMLFILFVYLSIFSVSNLLERPHVLMCYDSKNGRHHLFIVGDKLSRIFEELPPQIY